MSKPETVMTLNGHASREDAEARRNKLMRKDLYGLYCIYVDDKTQLWAPMPLKVLNAMMEFNESEEAKKEGP
jgi:hypothetical protein